MSKKKEQNAEKKEMDKLFSLHMDKLEIALKRLDNTQIGEIIRLLVDYQKTGIIKNYPEKEIAILALDLLLQSLIALNEKRDTFSEAQRKRANKRWEKEKNQGNNPKIDTKTDTAVCHGIQDYSDLCRGISGIAEPCHGIAEYANKEKEKEKDTETDKDKETDKALSEPSSPSGKKKPLREREPINDFEFVEKAYWTNWDMLYSKKLVQTKDPVVSWGQSRKLIKNYFEKNIKPIQLVEIINGALHENWIMQKGYSLTNILTSSYVNSVINKINVLSDSTALVATPLYNTALDCFTKEPAIKAMIFQDEYSKNIQFQCLQDIIARCLNIAPNMPRELFINITEHFYALCNGKYKGKWTYTPRCLKTNWIWELVIDSLPKTKSPEVKQIIRGLFK